MHSKLVQPNFIQVDTEFTDAGELELVGVIVAAKAATATVDIFDGNPGTQKIQLKVATDGDGRAFMFGGIIKFATSIRVVLTDCNATIIRNIKIPGS